MRLQRTIRQIISFEGIGLHTGRHAKVTLKPAPKDTGIVFVRTDKAITFKATVGSVTDTAFATTIGNSGITIKTVEHLLSALAGIGIDNVSVQVEGPEIPIFDGSSTDLVSVITDAGIEEQDKERPFMRIKKPFLFEDGHSTIAVLPYNGTRISYSIFYSHFGVGEQSISLDISEETFVNEVASARTFGFFKDIEYLRLNGLAKGGSLDNAIVLGEHGVLNSSGLRFRDEFVRHKVLDIIGDFSLIGFPIYGHIIVNKSGHSTNIRFLKKIMSNTDVWDIISEKSAPVSPVLHINA